MCKLVTLVLFTAVMAYTFHIAFTISCYECSGQKGGRCDKGTVDTIVHCKNVNQCFMEDIRTQKGRRVSRGCLDDPIIDYCTSVNHFVSLHYPKHKVFACYICEIDLCNKD